MKRLDRVLAAVLRGVCVACIVLLFLIVTVSVVNRFGAFMSMGWADELIELLFAWLVFLGTACLWREGAHFRIDMLAQRLAGKPGGRVLEVVLGLLAIAFMATLTWQAWQLVITASDDSPVFAISKKYWYGVVPVAGVIMIGYSVRDIFKALTRRPRNDEP
jgi:TRAP-type C4-dicarboxylate transport system permease small subunit